MTKDQLKKFIVELEEENKKLKEDNNNLQTGPYKYSYIKKLKKQNEKLEEGNKKLKLENAKLKDRIITDENFEEKLDKENKKLKDKIEHLEFDIEAWKKLKAVWEKKVQEIKEMDKRPL